MRIVRRPGQLVFFDAAFSINKFDYVRPGVKPQYFGMQRPAVDDSLAALQEFQRLDDGGIEIETFKIAERGMAFSKKLPLDPQSLLGKEKVVLVFRVHELFVAVMVVPQTERIR